MKPVLVLLEKSADASEYAPFREMQLLYGLVPVEVQVVKDGFTFQREGDKYSMVIVPTCKMLTTQLPSGAKIRDILATWLDGSIPAFVANAINAEDFTTTDGKQYTAGVTNRTAFDTSTWGIGELYDINENRIGSDGQLPFYATTAHAGYYRNSYDCKPLLQYEGNYTIAWAWTGGKYPVVYFSARIGFTPFLLYAMKLANLPISIPVAITLDDADGDFIADPAKIESMLARIQSLDGYALCGFKVYNIASIPNALKVAYSKYSDAVISIAHGHTASIDDEYWWHEKDVYPSYGIWGSQHYDITKTGTYGTSASNPGSGKLGALSYDIAHLKAQGWIPNLQEHQHYCGYCYLPNNGYSMAGLRALVADGVKMIRGSISFSQSGSQIVRISGSQQWTSPTLVIKDDNDKDAVIRFMCPSWGVNGTSDGSSNLSDLCYNTVVNLARIISYGSIIAMYTHGNNYTNDTTGAKYLYGFHRNMDLIEFCQPVLRLLKKGEVPYKL